MKHFTTVLLLSCLFLSQAIIASGFNPSNFKSEKLVAQLNATNKLEKNPLELIIFQKWTAVSQLTKNPQRSKSAFIERCDSMITYDPNDEITGRDLYTYNSKGQLAIYMMILKSDTLWLGIPMYFSYDEAGNNTEIVSARYDAALKQYVESRKSIFQYDDKGNQISEYYYYKDSTNHWQTDYAFESTYDSLGRKATDRYFDQDYLSNTVIEFAYYKYAYEVDAHNNITKNYEYEWDKPTNTWLDPSVTEFTYTYDNQGRITQQIDMGSAFGFPYPLANHKYTYDASGNNSVLVEFTWDWYKNDWVEFSKTINTFDYTVPLSETLMPAIILEGSNLARIKIAEHYDWIASATDWTLSFKTENFYNAISTGIVAQKANRYAYFNQVNSSLYVIGADNAQRAAIQIFDLQGKLVRSKEFYAAHTENLSQLPKGFYVYKLKIGKELVSGKFIKE